MEHDDEKQLLLEPEGDPLAPDYVELFREGSGEGDALVEPSGAAHVATFECLRTLMRGDRFVIQVPFLSLDPDHTDGMPAVPLLARGLGLKLEGPRGPKLIDLRLEAPGEMLTLLPGAASPEGIDLDCGISLPGPTGAKCLALTMSIEARRWSDVVGQATETAAEVFGALLALRLAKTLTGGWETSWFARLRWRLGSFELSPASLGHFPNRLSLTLDPGSEHEERRASKRGDWAIWTERTKRLARLYAREHDAEAQALLSACRFLAVSKLAWSPGERVLWLYSSLEALLLDPAANESTTARLCEAASCFVGRGLEHRRSVAKHLSDAYRLRSEYVHTGRIDRNLQGIAAKARRGDSKRAGLPLGRALRATLDRVETHVVAAIQRSFRDVPV